MNEPYVKCHTVWHREDKKYYYLSFCCYFFCFSFLHFIDIFILLFAIANAKTEPILYTLKTWKLHISTIFCANESLRFSLTNNWIEQKQKKITLRMAIIVVYFCQFFLCKDIFRSKYRKYIEKQFSVGLFLVLFICLSVLRNSIEKEKHKYNFMKQISWRDIFHSTQRALCLTVSQKKNNNKNWKYKT